MGQDKLMLGSQIGNGGGHFGSGLEHVFNGQTFSTTLQCISTDGHDNPILDDRRRRVRAKGLAGEVSTSLREDHRDSKLALEWLDGQCC